jgi:hypothetical protein
MHLTFMRPCIMINFLHRNQLDALISQIYSWNETLHVSDSSSVHQEFFTVHTAMVCHTGLLTACKQDQDGTRFHPDPDVMLMPCSRAAQF